MAIRVVPAPGASMNVRAQTPAYPDMTLGFRV